MTLDDILRYRILHADIEFLVEEIFCAIKNEYPEKLKFGTKSFVMEWHMESLRGIVVTYGDSYDNSELFNEEFDIPYEVFVGNYHEWIKNVEKFW